MSIMTRDENTANFDRLEFWALTTVFISCLLLFLHGDIRFIARYLVFFLAIIFIDFKILPGLLRGDRPVARSLGLTGALAILVATYVITSENLTGAMIAIAILAGHLVLKQVALFILSKADLLRSFFVIVNRDGLMAFGLWMIVMYWLLILQVPNEVQFAWMGAVPTGILLHGLAFQYFIPTSLRSKYSFVIYFFQVGFFCVAMSLAVSICTMLINENEDAAFANGAFAGIVNMIFTAPLLLLIYRWQVKGKEQINALQNELGRSAANLDFLRSQINPHFLFNALNTIYGLAIQEKAERTSASVEKLGDMMRFMLLENMQAKIPLRRELEYLGNYISLQRLRTDNNSQLTIRVDIPAEIDPSLMITPMLLIPFVENAFKHGISFREVSYIKVTLELKDSNLYFDVINSKHQKTDNDPERNNNGIGLENVRQRLKHIYPDRHELLTRDTGRDFFVHLRIELNNVK